MDFFRFLKKAVIVQVDVFEYDLQVKTKCGQFRRKFRYLPVVRFSANYDKLAVYEGEKHGEEPHPKDLLFTSSFDRTCDSYALTRHIVDVKDNIVYKWWFMP